MAFDSVPRRLLIHKLASYHHVRGRILKLLHSIYSQNVIRVFDGVVFGTPISQTVGVLQGDSLSPLMFIMFIADLPALLTAVRDISCILYADDLVFYSESLESVQNAVDVLHQYCSVNELTVNTSKTKVLKFRRGGRLKNSDVVWYGNEKLEFCSDYEYLGLTLQPTWTFSRHFRLKRNKMIVRSNTVSKSVRELSVAGAIKHLSTVC